MSPDEAVHSLNDHNARILACGTINDTEAEQLRLTLASIRDSAEAGSPPHDLLALLLRVLDPGSSADFTTAMVPAVSDAISALASHLEGSSEAMAAVEMAKSVLRPLAACPNPGPLPTCPPATGQAGPDVALVEKGLWAGAHCDADLVRDFMVEACERIASAEAALLALEANPDDQEQVNTVLRAFHTVKGASGFLGLDHVQQLAHLAENILIACREGRARMVGGNVDLALQSCDALKTLIHGVDPALPAGERRPVPAGLDALLQRLSEGAVAAEANDEQASPSPAEALRATDGEDNPTVAPEPKSQDRQSPTDASVRVGTGRLDDLMNMVGELVIAHSIIAQHPTVSCSGNQRLTASVAQAGKIVRGLQDLALRLRMVPLRATFGRMARLVRDLARKSGKEVRFVASGEDTEIDRTMVEVLGDPLVHLIRNAVDHGIEPAGERRRRGKPASGTIWLRAYHSVDSVVIELQDDGRGLDRERILTKAVAAGLVDRRHEAMDADVAHMIFLPGLSTAEQVTSLSGRGVGMDVVKRNVESLRGRIEIQSEDGRGCTFVLRLPLTTAITEAMLVRVGRERFLLPLVAIEHSFRPTPEMLTTVTGRGEMVQVRGRLLPLFRLCRLFGIAGAIEDPLQALLIAVEGAGRRCAVMVDQLHGQQQVVVKSLGPAFASVPGVSGGAILGDGRVGLILDAAGLVGLSESRAQAA